MISTELLEDITKNMLALRDFGKKSQLKELSTQEDYQGFEPPEVTSLTNDEMAYISTLFSILRLLINISEDVDLAYEIRFAGVMKKRPSPPIETSR